MCLRTTANSFLLVTFPSLEGRTSSAGKGGARVSKRHQLSIRGMGGVAMVVTCGVGGRLLAGSGMLLREGRTPEDKEDVC